MNTEETKKESIGIDIDGTLTIETEGWDYEKRTPNMSMILRVREWYKAGFRIVLITSRRSIDREVTINWMKKYDVPFHELFMDKPLCSCYIDDKTFRPEEVEGYDRRIKESQHMGNKL